MRDVRFNEPMVVQACADFEVAIGLLRVTRSSGSTPNDAIIAKCSQAVEKLLKAFLMCRFPAEAIKIAKSSHNVVLHVRRVSEPASETMLRMLANIANPQRSDLIQLLQWVPANNLGAPNTEYPFELEGSVETACQYFSIGQVVRSIQATWLLMEHLGDVQNAFPDKATLALRRTIEVLRQQLPVGFSR